MEQTLICKIASEETLRVLEQYPLGCLMETPYLVIKQSAMIDKNQTPHTNCEGWWWSHRTWETGSL